MSRRICHQPWWEGSTLRRDAHITEGRLGRGQVFELGVPPLPISGASWTYQGEQWAGHRTQVPGKQRSYRVWAGCASQGGKNEPQSLLPAGGHIPPPLSCLASCPTRLCSWEPWQRAPNSSRNPAESPTQGVTAATNQSQEPVRHTEEEARFQPEENAGVWQRAAPGQETRPLPGGHLATLLLPLPSPLSL